MAYTDPLTQITDEPIWSSFKVRDVIPEWQEELVKYLVMGYRPGGFHTAIFSNNLYRATHSAHYTISLEVVVQLVHWIKHFGPPEAFGSEEKVNDWLNMTNEGRHDVLLRLKLLVPAETLSPFK